MYTYPTNTPASPRNRQSYSRGGSPSIAYSGNIDPTYLMPNNQFMASAYRPQVSGVPLQQVQPGFTVQDYSPRSKMSRTSPVQTTPPLLGQQGWDSGAQFYYISPASSACRGSPRELPTAEDANTTASFPQHQYQSSTPVAASGSRGQTSNALHPSNALSAEDIARYGYPTGRMMPTGLGTQTMNATAAANAHLLSLSDPVAAAQGYYQTTSFAPRPRSREPSPNYVVGGGSEFPTPESVHSASFASNLLSYLSLPGPIIDPRLVAGEPPKQSKRLHSWIDVRNVRSWEDFNLSTIMSSPEMKRVLSLSSNLPTPIAPNGYGMSNKELLAKTASHLCVRVNLALGLAQGQPHLAIRTLGDGRNSYFQADFVSSYQDDKEFTIFGDGRGRVVGVLKSSNLWQSRWKRGSVFEQKKYLGGLADIHQAMRDHGCRYGFIVTEMELICVRYRTRSSNRKLPYFGSVELSESLPMANMYQSSMSSAPSGPQLTPGLALFYLHMLARKGGMEGQYHWKLDVGKPEDLTRQTYERRDEWMPEILKEDERKMKNVRGWTYPKDKLNKKERDLVRPNRRNRRR